MKTFNQLNSNDKQWAIKQAKDMLFGLLVEGVLELDPKDYTRNKIDYIAEAAAENALYQENNGILEVIF